VKPNSAVSITNVPGIEPTGARGMSYLMPLGRPVVPDE
jgi:hypothetical protein